MQRNGNLIIANRLLLFQQANHKPAVVAVGLSIYSGKLDNRAYKIDKNTDSKTAGLEALRVKEKKVKKCKTRRSYGNVHPRKTKVKSKYANRKAKYDFVFKAILMFN